jgi:hypothetical protein
MSIQYADITARPAALSVSLPCLLVCGLLLVEYRLGKRGMRASGSPRLHGKYCSQVGWGPSALIDLYMNTSGSPSCKTSDPNNGRLTTPQYFHSSISARSKTLHDLPTVHYTSTLSKQLDENTHLHNPLLLLLATTKSLQDFSIHFLTADICF